MIETFKSSNKSFPELIDFERIPRRAHCVEECCKSSAFNVLQDKIVGYRAIDSLLPERGIAINNMGRGMTP